MPNAFVHLPYGRHIFAELFPNNCSKLDDIPFLEGIICRAAIDSGASVLNVCSHKFDPMGVTTLVLLAESHISLHTYPEDGVAFFDAFTCGIDIFPLDILTVFCDLYEDCKFSHILVERNPFNIKGLGNAN